MLSEMRGAILLVVTLTVFVIIIGVLALGTVMKPNRWSERPRRVSCTGQLQLRLRDPSQNISLRLCPPASPSNRCSVSWHTEHELSKTAQ